MAKQKLEWPLSLSPKQQADLAAYLMYRLSLPSEERAGMGKCVLCDGDHPAPSPANCVQKPATPKKVKVRAPLLRPSGKIMGKVKREAKDG